MQIFNLQDREARDIEKPLRQLAATDDPLKAVKGQKLLNLVSYLQARGPAPEAYGSVRGQELWLSPWRRANRVSIQIGLDWNDYGPLQDGLPLMHYRVKIRRRGEVLTTEERADLPEVVERIILEAFDS
jgi:hypothetical protein